MKILPRSRGALARLAVLLALLLTLVWVYREGLALAINRAPVLYHYERYVPQEGDIIFQSLPHGDLVDAIEGITHSPYSHCGVVLRNKKGEWKVIEAIFTVHETPLFLWEARGRGGAFDVYRLDAAHAAQIAQFKQALQSFRGLPYDYDYDMSKPGKAYCSGLAYLAFEKATGEKMGQLERLRDLDWKPYESFIRDVQAGGLPLDRVMITPAALARAPQLHLIYASLPSATTYSGLGK
jgi:hypothetical protein